MTNFKLLQELNELKNLVKQSNLNSKEVFNFQELLKYIGFSESTLYKLTSSRLIPFHKPTNGALFFFKDEIHDWIKGNKVHTEQEALDMLAQHKELQNKKA